MGLAGETSVSPERSAERIARLDLVVGIAASMASVIALAGDEAVMCRRIHFSTPATRKATPTGQPIAFTIVVRNGWTDWIDAVQIATEGLRKAGINASVGTPEYEQWQKQILDGSFDAVMNSRADGPTPFRGYYQSLSTAFGGRITPAPSRYSNAELDKVFDAYRKATTDEERHKLFDQVQMIVLTTCRSCQSSTDRPGISSRPSTSPVG
jgi:ABC-type transport system substrate-binding protein